MKTIPFVTIVISLFLLVSCKKEDSIATPLVSTNLVNSTVVSGTWKITYYWDTDKNETANFNGYAFTFGSGNVLTALKNGSTIPGTWATGADDSKIKLILDFPTPSIFFEISDDWHVIERTETKIKLEDVSGGNGGTDYLTFEKN